MRQSRIISATWASAFGLLLATQAVAQFQYDPDAVAAARADFVERMVALYEFDRQTLADILSAAEIRQSILDAISRPAERVVPWHEYRLIFLNDDRIRSGVEFWRANRAQLATASDRYGVDPEIIVAIIGIETLYGRRMGSYRVIDALATLAFAYPPRASFFASELEAFLLLVREEDIDMDGALGSYAGAMGAGQFIPSSFRAYAVDGDADGRRDLWQNWDDIFASVANYLDRHGWRRGETIAVPAARRPASNAAEPADRFELDTTVAALRTNYDFDRALEPDLAASVYALERADGGMDYWVGLDNFYVITRYNRSVKYAMAAYELSRELRLGMETLPEVSQ